MRSLSTLGEASALLALAMAEQDVCHAEKVLADSRVEETIRRLQFCQMQAAEAYKRKQKVDLLIGVIRHLLREGHHGEALKPAATVCEGIEQLEGELISFFTLVIGEARPQIHTMSTLRMVPLLLRWIRWQAIHAIREETCGTRHSIIFALLWSLTEVMLVNNLKRIYGWKNLSLAL
jgi:hypothetical protein